MFCKTVFTSTTHGNLIAGIFNFILILMVVSLSPGSYAQTAPDRATKIPGTNQGTILVFGDSISAAYGMELAQGWVKLLDDRLQANNLHYQVINASVSGETTGGGVVRLSKALDRYKPGLVVLELGGNDGLRGYPINKIRGNLNTMTEQIIASGASVILVGMVLPPNYGRRYTEAFEQLFAELASKFSIDFLPFLLDGVATNESLLQRDGIHPTPEAQSKLLDEIWPLIRAHL